MLSNKYIVNTWLAMENRFGSIFRKALQWGKIPGAQKPTQQRVEKSSRGDGRRRASGVGSVASVSVNSPFFSTAASGSFAYHVANGYQKNCVVYSGVNFIARCVASVRLRVHEKDKKVDNHPLMRLLERPNMDQSYPAFCASVITHLLLSGNSFIYGTGLGAKGSVPLEVYTLRPDRVSLKMDDKGFTKAYLYGEEVIPYHNPQCPIAHVKLFNPLDCHYGMSPLQSAQSMIELHNAITEYHLVLMQNYGMPKGVLTFKDSYLNDEQREELNETLKTFRESNGGFLILDGPGTFEMLSSLSPQDMDFANTKKEAAIGILNALNLIPKHMGDSSFSDRDQVSLHLWENTLLPWLELYVGELNRFFQRFYGSDISIDYCQDDIPALTARRKEWWRFIDSLDCLSLEEKRQMVDL